MVHEYLISGIVDSLTIYGLREILRKHPDITAVSFDDVNKKLIIEMSTHVSLDRINDALKVAGLRGIYLNQVRVEEKKQASKTNFSELTPLAVIFLIIILFVAVRAYLYGFNFSSAMYDFMAAFFILLSLLKLINWSGFVEAYQTYDIVAKRSQYYAYAYPLIELGLGICYLLRWQLTTVNIITLVIMLVSSIGVMRELRAGKTITCACLGVVFNVPMTWVTFIEDILMATMAAIMLFY